MNDWPAVDAMLRRMHQTRGEYAYQSGPACVTFRRCIQGSFARIAEDGQPVGVMLANLSQSWCSTEMLSQELVVWVNPEARGKWINAFLDNYREWLSRVGARGAIACPDERLARVLKRRGHSALETIFEVT